MTEPVDWGARAHDAAAKHIDACERYLACTEGDCEQHDPDQGESCPRPDTAGPFCSCSTCTIRETLHAAWPVLDEAGRHGAFDSPRPWEPDTEPADEVLAEWLLNATPHERLLHVSTARTARAEASRCFIENHTRVHEENARLRAEVADLHSHVNRLSTRPGEQ